jgi:hypothetical protein
MIPPVVWPVAMLLSAVGLRAIAPRRAPFLYLGPVATTVALIALAAATVAAIFR